MKSWTPNAVVIWIWLCAYLNCAGWILSALHQLNAGGYVVALTFGFGALLVWRKKTAARIIPQVRRGKLSRRFRRSFPFAFLILAGMVFLGGALYPPSNYDALGYRTPRGVHWLGGGHWHGVHTVFPRNNTRACGIEWGSTAVISVVQTDRGC